MLGSNNKGGKLWQTLTKKKNKNFLNIIFEECIMQECESAGLEISEDEDLAEERGYDRAFEVVNPYKNKLEKIKKILKTNIKQWDETQHDPVEEFKLLVEMIDEE